MTDENNNPSLGPPPAPPERQQQGTFTLSVDAATGKRYISDGRERFWVSEDTPEPDPKRPRSPFTPSSRSISTPKASNATSQTSQTALGTSKLVTQTTTRSSPSKSPKGPPLQDLANEVVLLTWLRKHAKDSTSLVSRPHLLPGEKLQYSLQNRSDAMEKSETLLRKIFVSTTEKVASREEYDMPVCSAMSGIGKSRMLDEWVRKFESKDSTCMICDEFPPAPRRVALVMSYGNGHSVTAYERSMGSQAGFAWRLLHGVFLDGNTELGWEEFWQNLPENAQDLTLRLALRVIRLALKGSGSCPEDAEATAAGENRNEHYALFVGIDEYQCVPKNDKDDPNKHQLAPLLKAIVGEMSNSPPVVILPMFAGTDWSKMSFAASGLSNELTASAFTTRLSMPLLDPEEMRKAVLGRGAGAEKLLQQEIFCRNLFFLGGVPRPCTHYTEDCLIWQKKNAACQVGEARRHYQTSFDETISKFFAGVFSKAPEDKSSEKTGFTLRELIWLVAYSVRGGAVKEEDRPFDKLTGSKRRHLTFRRLRDCSVCILGTDQQLQLPYCFFYKLSRSETLSEDLSDPERAFLDVLQYLRQYVDHKVFHPGNSPWQQWELFGACYTALRINAILITLGTNVKLSRIFEGSAHNLKIDHEIKLHPMRVVRTESKFDRDLPASILMNGEDGEKDWVSNGLVVMNGDNGKGIDIFYTLELAHEQGKYVLVTDQRKRVQGVLNLQRNIEKARIIPGGAQAEAGIKHVVVALFSMFTCAPMDKLPMDSIAVTFEQHSAFHGSLHQHPAASFRVRVNVDGVTALSGLFKSGGGGAKAIMDARKEKSIQSFDELLLLLGDVAKNLWDDAESLCIFSC